METVCRVSETKGGMEKRGCRDSREMPHDRRRKVPLMAPDDRWQAAMQQLRADQERRDRIRGRVIALTIAIAIAAFVWRGGLCGGWLVLAPFAGESLPPSSSMTPGHGGEGPKRDPKYGCISVCFWGS